MLQPNVFDGIATEDESWFRYVYMSNSMFAPSRDLAGTRTKDAERAKKTMLTVFFASRWLIVLEALPKETTCTQHYFLSDILPDLDGEKLRYRRKNPGQDFFGTWTIQNVATQRRSRESSKRNTSPEHRTHHIRQT
jgi:hypothetical protein